MPSGSWVSRLGTIHIVRQQWELVTRYLFLFFLTEIFSDYFSIPAAEASGKLPKRTSAAG